MASLSLPVNRLRYLRHFCHGIIRFFHCRYQWTVWDICAISFIALFGLSVVVISPIRTQSFLLILRQRNIQTNIFSFYINAIYLPGTRYIILSILQYSTGICTNVYPFNFIPLFLITKFYCFVRTCSSCKFLFIWFMKNVHTRLHFIS